MADTWSGMVVDHGDGTMSRPVDIKSALPAGTANIGDVDVLTLPAIPAGESHVGQVGGAVVKVAVEKTRPADTNAYTANDALNESASAGTNWTFALGRLAAGSGLIVAAHILTDDVTWVSRMELSLFDANPAVINDNAEATGLYANAALHMGRIAWPALSRHTANSTMNDAAVWNLNIPYKCVAGGNIYGILRVLDAVAAPIASKKYTVILEALQD